MTFTITCGTCKKPFAAVNGHYRFCQACRDALEAKQAARRRKKGHAEVGAYSSEQIRVLDSIKTLESGSAVYAEMRARADARTPAERDALARRFPILKHPERPSTTLRATEAA